MIFGRRSRSEWRSFGFTYPYVRMQWVSHYWHIAHKCSSILWYIPWQDWARFSTSRFNFNIYCTPADCCAQPNAQKKMEDPRRPHESSLLLAPKPQKQCINPLCWVAGRKYQKLYLYFKRIFSRNGAISISAAWFLTNMKSLFLGGYQWFETAVHPNSITWPHHRPMVTSYRPFKASAVVHRPCTRRRRHISMQM